MLDYGHQRMQEGDYYNALNTHERLMRIDSSNGDILYGYGKNLYLMGNFQKASQYLQKAYNLDRGKEHQFLPYELAESYRNSGDYRMSRRYYTKALRPFRRDRKGYWYKRVNQSKKSASWAIKNTKKTAVEDLETVDEINAQSTDFAAIKNQEQWYFTSLRADSMILGHRVLDQDYYTKIYTITKTGNTKALYIEKKEGLHQKNVGNLAFGKGDIVYFSVCDSAYNCDIWKGQLKGLRISQTEKLNSNINPLNSNNTQPMWVEIEGQSYLYFVSNREKGFGELDVWLSKEESFGFDVPINLGNTINTEGNEITPYYNIKDHQLYFSSDWRNGYGGYDIFKALGGPKIFKKAENIGQNINSTSDDYYFNFKEELAYLSSNRKAKGSATIDCCNDVYSITYEEEEYLETDPKKAEVTVAKLNKYLPLSLFFHNDSPDPNSRLKTTESNYNSLVKDYMAMKGEYTEKMSKIGHDTTKIQNEFELDFFFEEEIKEGFEKLKTFTPLLLKELDKGTQVELTVKGYASSLSNNDYNLNLTYRRIQSFENYLKASENGAFVAYLENKASNGGSLKITALPYGEFASKGNYNQNNKVEAVYSPYAARERRIEIMAVTYDAEGQAKALDDRSLQQRSKMNVLNLDEKDRLKVRKTAMSNIRIKNEGNADLELYTVQSNCDCLDFSLPKAVKAGGTAEIELKALTSPLPNQVLISIFSNGIPNRHEFKLVFY